MAGKPFEESRQRLDEVERLHGAKMEEARRRFGARIERERADLDEAERSFRAEMEEADRAFRAGIEKARADLDAAERAASRPPGAGEGHCERA